MSLHRETMRDASRVINSTLGVSCTYESADGDIVVTEIVVAQNKEVRDDFNTLIGYRCEAALLKEDIPDPKINERFIDEDNVTWQVNLITKETSSKWYVDVVMV